MKMKLIALAVKFACQQIGHEWRNQQYLKMQAEKSA